MVTERELKEFFVEYENSTDVNAITHTVQVTSFGGAGTTALCAHLDKCGADIQSGPAHWPFKHRRHPPVLAATPTGFRAIYLVSEPRDAILSLFRRNYQVGHFKALNEREPTPAELVLLESLFTFVDGKVDVLGLGSHVDAWLTPGRGYPTLVVNHENLADSWPVIADFAGLGDQVPAFPRRDRHSSWEAQSEPIRVGLTNMFGELAERISALPATSLIN